jgi:hypothetical protein
MSRRGGFAVLVKRVAEYEVIHDGEATVETVPRPETLFPRALLHGSAIAQMIVRALRRSYRSIGGTSKGIDDGPWWLPLAAAPFPDPGRRFLD